MFNKKYVHYKYVSILGVVGVLEIFKNMIDSMLDVLCILSICITFYKLFATSRSLHGKINQLFINFDHWIC